MIERIARILDPEAFSPGWELNRPGQPSEHEQRRRGARGGAATLIEAMREPTDKMASNGYQEGSRLNEPEEAREIWRAMIDAALADPPDEPQRVYGET